MLMIFTVTQSSSYHHNTSCLLVFLPLIHVFFVISPCLPPLYFQCLSESLLKDLSSLQVRPSHWTVRKNRHLCRSGLWDDRLLGGMIPAADTLEQAMVGRAHRQLLTEILLSFHCTWIWYHTVEQDMTTAFMRGFNYVKYLLLLLLLLLLCCCCCCVVVVFVVVFVVFVVEVVVSKIIVKNEWDRGLFHP